MKEISKSCKRLIVTEMDGTNKRTDIPITNHCIALNLSPSMRKAATSSSVIVAKISKSTFEIDQKLPTIDTKNVKRNVKRRK